MDATAPVRVYLKKNEFHDYELQKQGTEHKVIVEAHIYESFSVHKADASLYRPNTKKGDPRIWFSRLKSYAKPNDILALFGFEEVIHVLNITRTNIKGLLDIHVANPVQDLIRSANIVSNSTAEELLDKLRKIAKQPILSMLDADTSVGRTLETALGIDINSSRQPDYKGIEIKSFRTERTNRKTLFAQVPNWKLSKFKSSAEILDAFGYWRDKDFKLNCTVSTQASNSQGLSLIIDNEIGHLLESSDKKSIGDFAVWELEMLHERLQEKHKETFWVSADSLEIDGKNYFQYFMVEHTKSPITTQFDILLDQGIITLDHLIKRNAKGRVVERGPLFKIKPKSLNLLFPPSSIYQLQ
ncbi:MAG: MvaI/BcnI family restriction endonuclease [Marinoscillum sp.]